MSCEYKIDVQGEIYFMLSINMIKPCAAKTVYIQIHVYVPKQISDQIKHVSNFSFKWIKNGHNNSAEQELHVTL